MQHFFVNSALPGVGAGGDECACNALFVCKWKTCAHREPQGRGHIRKGPRAMTGTCATRARTGCPCLFFPSPGGPRGCLGPTRGQLPLLFPGQTLGGGEPHTQEREYHLMMIGAHLLPSQHSLLRALTLPARPYLSYFQIEGGRARALSPTFNCLRRARRAVHGYIFNWPPRNVLRRTLLCIGEEIPKRQAPSRSCLSGVCPACELSWTTVW